MMDLMMNEDDERCSGGCRRSVEDENARTNNSCGAMMMEINGGSPLRLAVELRESSATVDRSEGMNGYVYACVAGREFGERERVYGIDVSIRRGEGCVCGLFFDRLGKNREKKEGLVSCWLFQCVRCVYRDVGNAAWRSRMRKDVFLGFSYFLFWAFLCFFWVILGFYLFLIIF